LPISLRIPRIGRRHPGADQFRHDEILRAAASAKSSPAEHRDIRHQIALNHNSFGQHGLFFRWRAFALEFLFVKTPDFAIARAFQVLQRDALKMRGLPRIRRRV